MTIKQLTARETYPVRHTVLRKGRPLEDCAFDGDNLATTFHLGALQENELVAVATFVLNKDPDILQLQQLEGATCYQLRGMAVQEEFQGQQIGKMLLLQGEQILREKNIKHLWFNAREIAIPFYKKLGYIVVSDIFEIIPVGMHYKMYKAL
jgi:GNAT superfamily N-acetyltransferase